MPFFETTMQQMQAFRQLQRARQEGCSPVALTGCAMVQKAQLALTLSSPEQPVLSDNPTSHKPPLTLLELALRNVVGESPSLKVPVLPIPTAAVDTSMHKSHLLDFRHEITLGSAVR